MPEAMRHKETRSQPTQPPLSRPFSSAPSKSKKSASSVNSSTSSPSAISSSRWKLDDILGDRQCFKPVERISIGTSDQNAILQAIEKHEASGLPLIIEGFHRQNTWPGKLFNVDWLQRQYGDQTCSVRDVSNRTDQSMRLKQYIAYSRMPESERKQVLYYKDALCPPEWREWVNKKDGIPSVLLPHGEQDLFQHLTDQESVESLMCYLGCGPTYTPCHKDLCASSGQNIMCYAENGGSSFWFMTATSDAPLVGAFFQQELKSEVDWERHNVTLEQFAKAPFTVYVAQQKVGDLVLVPPRSCHQVVNQGGLTIKTSWSRMTIPGLRMALRYELPIYRRVCRPEQYRVKFIVFRSLLKRAQELRNLVEDDRPRVSTSRDPRYMSELLKVPHVERQVHDLETLIELFDAIIHEEWTPNHHKLPTILSAARQIGGMFQSRSPSKRKPTPSSHALQVEATECNFACDFCGSDIFQSFFECRECSVPSNETAEPDIDAGASTPRIGSGLIICPSCYVEGRTCKCALMNAAQCGPFQVLFNARNDATDALRMFGHRFSKYTHLADKLLPQTGLTRTFEAGCILLSNREARKRSAAIAQRSKSKGMQGHEEDRDGTLNCNVCHGGKRFAHLLLKGIHSTEALLLHKAGARAWHARHNPAEDINLRNNGIIEAQRRESEDDSTSRQAMVTLSYPSCCSLNPGYTKPGWYDTPLYPQSEPAPQVQDQVEPSVVPCGKDKSPDVPIMSQEISFPPAWVQSTTQLSESPLSLLSELPDPPSNDTMLPNPAIVFAAKFPQRAYVLLPSMRKRRRMTQEPDAQRKTKRRKNNVERTTTSHGSATALDSDEDDRRVEEDYAAPLAQALANANSEQPQFTSKLVQMPLDLQAPRDSQSSSPKRQTASADSTPPVGAPRGASHTSRRGGKGKVSSRTILPFRPISTVPPDDIPNSRPTHRLPRATPMRAKPGRPPGIRDKKGPIAQKTTKASIPVPVQIPSTTGNADDTLQASQSPARAVELSNGRQMANASSSHNSASRPVGEGGSPDKLGASLRKLSKEVKSPRKELQNPRTEQDRLDTRLQTEYLERSHFELYSKEKEQETQRLTEELHEEKAARAQLQEQLRGEIEMREQREARLQADILHEAQMREQAVKQLHQLHADVRNAVEEAGKACLDRMERSQPQPPAAPSSPDRSSHWQAGLGDHVRMLVMDMLRSSGVNQYNHSPSTMVIPHLPNAVAPLRGGNMDGQVLLQPMEWAYSTIQSTFPQPHVMTTNPTYLDRQRRDNQISAVQSSRGHSSIRTGSRGGRMRTQDARISSVGSGFLEDSISHNGQNASTSTLPPPTAPRVHQPPENRARSVARDREPETPHHPYDDRTSRSRPERPRDHQTYGTHRSTGTRTDTPFSSRR